MILRSVFWYFCFVGSLLSYTPKLFLTRRKEKTMESHEFNRYVNRLVSGFALSNVKRSGARFHIEGMENVPKDETVVFVSNHQGDFDIAVFLAYLPIPHGYVAKIEMLKVPLLRDWMKLIKCIFIDRKNIRQTAKTFIEGIKILQSGHSLVLFPEGTRSKSEKLGEFKAASFKLATKAKVPIVPVSINGTFRIMEANKGLIKPADVYVKIHPIIRTDGMEDFSGLPEMVKGIIESGLKNQA